MSNDDASNEVSNSRRGDICYNKMKGSTLIDASLLTFSRRASFDNRFDGLSEAGTATSSRCRRPAGLLMLLQDDVQVSGGSVQIEQVQVQEERHRSGSKSEHHGASRWQRAA